MKNKILLVDDMEDILSILTYYLEKEGYEVETAENGTLAFEKIKNNSYTAVVCDILMPRMNGIDLLKKLRSENNLIPFLYLSGHGEEKEELEVTGMGAYGLIRKPFLRDVVPALKKLIQHDMEINDLCKGKTNEASDDFLRILNGTGKKII